jgi:hypothetical protein
MRLYRHRMATYNNPHLALRDLLSHGERIEVRAFLNSADQLVFRF